MIKHGQRTQITEEELENSHVNPAMKHYGLICVTMMLIGILVVTGIVIFDHLTSAVLADPDEIHQARSVNN